MQRIPLTYKKALQLVLLLFLVVMGIRTPHLTHPLSRHHESIPAYELITIASWQQAGGPAVFNFIPLGNFQQPGDKRIPDNAYTDKKGNDIYISYGTGWNLLPYYVFRILHVSATPVSLRVLNMLIGLIACLLLFRLMLLITTNKQQPLYAAVIACIALLFTPGMLWYTSNVYVNCSVAIPFIIGFLYSVTRMIMMPQTIKPGSCAVLFGVLVCLVNADWIGAFLAFTSALVLLTQLKKNRRLVYPLVTIILATVAAIGITLWQFVSYAGWPTVVSILTGKFGYRTIHASNGLLQPIGTVALHFITMFMPLIVLLLAVMVTARIGKQVIHRGTAARLLLTIFLPALLLYNITFFSWTAVHEFSVLYYGILFAIATGIAAGQVYSTGQLKIAMTALIVFTTIQYYLINPPGQRSLNGEDYDVYQKLGAAIAPKVKPEQVIFMNLDLLPPVMYYAKRNIHYAASLQQAKEQLAIYQGTEGVWIEQHNFSITGVEYFHK